MSSVGLTFPSAPEIQDDLNAYFDTFANPANQEFTPLTEFLQSEINGTNVLDMQLGPGGGKERQVVATWQPRYLETDVTEENNPRAACDCDNERGLLTETYTIPETGLRICESWDIHTLKDTREGTATWYARGIANMLSAMRRKLETKNTEEAVALVGNFAAEDDGVSSTVKTIQGWDGSPLATGKPLPGFSAHVDYSRTLVGAPQYALFGSGIATQYYKYVDAGCCVDGFGVDLNELYMQQQVAFFHSHRIPTAFGSSAGQTDILGLVPGALQHVYFNLYEGDNVIDGDIFKRMTIVDPVTGIAYDMTWTIDCDKLKVELLYRGGLVAPPDDYFCTGDRLDGFVGINQFRMTTS